MSSKSFECEGMWDRRLGQGYLTKGQGSLPHTAEMSPFDTTLSLLKAPVKLLSGI